MYICVYRFKQGFLWIPVPSLSHLYLIVTVPSKVGPPTLTKAARSARPALTVSWTVPQSDRPITKYQVLYRRSDSAWITEDVTLTSPTYTLENLSASAGYHIHVRAVLDVGAGSYSDVRAIVTFRCMYYRMFHHPL